MKNIKNSTPETTEQYHTVNRTIRMEIMKTKEEWISEQCDSIEKGIKVSHGGHTGDVWDGAVQFLVGHVIAP